MKNICQSCGMPLSKDPLGGGSEADGRKSALYCSHCYRHGSFTDPEITQEQMTAKVQSKLKEIGIPRFLGWLFTRKIPKLQRWNSCSSAEKTSCHRCK